MMSTAMVDVVRAAAAHQLGKDWVGAALNLSSSSFGFYCCFDLGSGGRSLEVTAFPDTVLSRADLPSLRSL